MDRTMRKLSNLHLPTISMFVILLMSRKEL
jgi:hypothetical protein